jgi:hypothetical protein
MSLRRWTWTAQNMYRDLGEQVFGYRFGNLSRGAIRTLKQQGVYDGGRLKKIIEEFDAVNSELTGLHDRKPKVPSSGSVELIHS